MSGMLLKELLHTKSEKKCCTSSEPKLFFYCF